MSIFTLSLNTKVSQFKPLFLFLFLSLSLAFVFSSEAANRYQVVDLVGLGGSSSEAFSINDANDVVGNSNGPTFAAHAYLSRNGQLTDMGTLLNETLIEGVSFAFDINNNNIAAGFSRGTTQEDLSDPESAKIDVNQAVYFDTDNLTITSIPQFVPNTPLESRAIGINDNDIVVGFGSFNPPDDVDSEGNPVENVLSRGFIYDINLDELTMVNPLGGEGSLNISLRDVNNNGLAIGISSQLVDGSGTNQVFSLDINDPETLNPIEIFGGISQQVWAVNNAGKIVGSGRPPKKNQAQAFVFDTQSTTLTPLGFLNDNFKFSEALDINESDQIVGVSQSQNAPIVFHAFLYEDSSMKNLNDLIDCGSPWILNEASSINNAGVITGTGLLNGQKRAFMLIPQGGEAPICEDENSSGGGSLPAFLLVLLGLTGLHKRKN